MADKKISALTSYAPVVGSVIIPASYLVDGKYTTGKIEASEIKNYVLKETDTKVATSTELTSFATAETIGKQIYLTTTDDNYGAGLYVVTGAGTVQKLAVSSATGDFGTDITNLQVKDEEIIASYTAADSAIITSYTDADSAIITSYTAADSALDARIKAIEDAPYVKQADLDTLEGKVTTNTEAITILNGDAATEGSVANQVTTKIAEVVASAPEDFDTLKEIADWIANDQTGAANLANRISTLENAGYATVSQVDTAKGEAVTSANEYTDEKIATVDTTITENEKVISASLNDLNGRVSTLEGFDHTVYALKSEVDSADNALSGRIDTLEAIQHDAFATKEEVQDVVTGYTGADTVINETISQLQATIEALQAKLAKYDERFGYQEDGDWTVNFLVID